MLQRIIMSDNWQLKSYKINQTSCNLVRIAMSKDEGIVRNCLENLRKTYLYTRQITFAVMKNFKAVFITDTT